MANGLEYEEYVAQARRVLLPGTGRPPLRNIVTSATSLVALSAHLHRNARK